MRLALFSLIAIVVFAGHSGAQQAVTGSGGQEKKVRKIAAAIDKGIDRMRTFFARLT